MWPGDLLIIYLRYILGVGQFGQVTAIGQVSHLVSIAHLATLAK